jgi:hypothetical protein
MKRVIKLILGAAKETPRGMFAPIIGAYKGIKNEYKLLAEIESKKVHRARLIK